jgi:hypothetical protein
VQQSTASSDGLVCATAVSTSAAHVPFSASAAKFETRCLINNSIRSFPPPHVVHSVIVTFSSLKHIISCSTTTPPHTNTLAPSPPSQLPHHHPPPPLTLAQTNSTPTCCSGVMKVLNLLGVSSMNSSRANV